MTARMQAIVKERIQQLSVRLQMAETGQSAGNVIPLALLFLVAMSLMILGSNRRNAVRALLITAACIPLGQEIVNAGLHFYFLGILILVGMAHGIHGGALRLEFFLTIIVVCFKIIGRLVRSETSLLLTGCCCGRWECALLRIAGHSFLYRILVRSTRLGFGCSP